MMKAAHEVVSQSVFANLSALREQHYTLLRRHNRGGDEAPNPAEVGEFLQKAAASGTQLESAADRLMAQSIIDYWATEQIVWTSDAFPNEVPELEAYDESRLPDLGEQPSPFKGLSAFTEADAPRFFGREEAAKSLLALVRERPLVVVSGRSGSGKSSLVMAGLVPLLRDERLHRWQVLGGVVPGIDPLGALLGAVHAPGQPEAPVTESARNALAHDPALLKQRLDTLVGLRANVVLVVDQFEELFSYRIYEKTRRATAAALAALGDRHRLVLTVRSDYRDQVQAMPELFPTITDPAIWVEAPPLTPRQLRAAIERPAAVAGLTFEDGLVHELVREVEGDAEALPLLQFTLARLWDRRERNRITLKAYRVVGRPRDALQRSAEEAYEILPHDQRWITERIFLRLVQPAVGDEFVRRRERRKEVEDLALPHNVRVVLDHFVAAGLLRQSPGAVSADDRYEIVHEALIRLWPRLHGWLHERRQELEYELQLLGAAQQWRKSGERREYLLRGRALANAAALRDADPEIAALVHISEAEDRRRRRRLVTFMGSNLAILTVLVTVLIFQLFKVERERAIGQVFLASANQALAAGIWGDLDFRAGDRYLSVRQLNALWRLVRAGPQIREDFLKGLTDPQNWSRLLAQPRLIERAVALAWTGNQISLVSDLLNHTVGRIAEPVATLELIQVKKALGIELSELSGRQAFMEVLHQIGTATDARHLSALAEAAPVLAPALSDTEVQQSLTSVLEQVETTKNSFDLVYLDRVVKALAPRLSDRQAKQAFSLLQQQIVLTGRPECPSEDSASHLNRLPADVVTA